jgi:hypothetical protein
LIAVVHVGIASELATYFIDIDNCEPRIATGISPDPLTAHRLNPFLVFRKRVVFSTSHGLDHTAIAVWQPENIARALPTVSERRAAVRSLGGFRTFGDGGCNSACRR